MDIEFMKFGGAIMGIAEREMGIAATGSEAMPFVKRLYEEFKASGTPLAKQKQWLQAKLVEEFKFVTKFPATAESTPLD